MAVGLVNPPKMKDVFVELVISTEVELGLLEGVVMPSFKPNELERLELGLRGSDLAWRLASSLEESTLAPKKLKVLDASSPNPLTAGVEAAKVELGSNEPKLSPLVIVSVTVGSALG